MHTIGDARARAHTHRTWSVNKNINNMCVCVYRTCLETTKMPIMSACCLLSLARVVSECHVFLGVRCNACGSWHRHTPMSSETIELRWTAKMEGLSSVLSWMCPVHESSRMHQLSRCELPWAQASNNNNKNAEIKRNQFTVTAIVDCQSAITNYAYELNRTHNNTTSDGRIDECKSNHLIRAIIYRSCDKNERNLFCAISARARVQKKLFVCIQSARRRAYALCMPRVQAHNAPFQ